eukprot:g6886.t1
MGAKCGEKFTVLAEEDDKVWAAREGGGEGWMLKSQLVKKLPPWKLKGKPSKEPGSGDGQEVLVLLMDGFWACACDDSSGLVGLEPPLRGLRLQGSAERAAENFNAHGDHSESLLGLGCFFDRTSLFVETADQQLVPVVEQLFLSEVSCHPIHSDLLPDMAVIAVVPPVTGQGIQGTSMCGCEAEDREGWFILIQGLSTAYDIMDVLSLRGCIRHDIENSYSLPADDSGIIGEGAYATVYHSQGRDKRPVAVKKMNCQSDFESIAREVSTLVEVQGPHIIGFRAIFWQQEVERLQVSMVFELASGDLLFKVLQDGPMDEPSARTLFVSILHGLKRIHDHGIVHRDIKTENILLQGDVPMVADFGLACKATDEQQMSRRCGSAGFVAPEVCLGSAYDTRPEHAVAGGGIFTEKYRVCVFHPVLGPRNEFVALTPHLKDYKVDTFGAGVILYFILSKELPFSSPDRDSAAIMRKTVKCNLHLQLVLTLGFRRIVMEGGPFMTFILRLICKSQEERLSADGALAHSWVVGKTAGGKKKELAEGDGAALGVAPPPQPRD